MTYTRSHTRPSQKDLGCVVYPLNIKSLSITNNRKYRPDKVEPALHNKKRLIEVSKQVLDSDPLWKTLKLICLPNIDVFETEDLTRRVTPLCCDS
jgi:hypothetical protein